MKDEQKERQNDSSHCETTPEMVIAGSDAASPFWTIITDPKSDLGIVPLMVTAIYEAMEAEKNRRR